MGVLIVETVICQRCRAEVVDLVDNLGPRQTHRRKPLTGELYPDASARAHNLHLEDGEDVICDGCLRKGYLWRATH